MKRKVFFNIFKIISLVVPITVYLMLSSFVAQPDYTIKVVEVADLSVIVYDDDSYFIYDTKAVKTAIYTVASPFNDEYGMIVDNGDLIKVGWQLYEVKDLELVKTNRFGFEKQLAYKIPLTLVISGLAVFIAIKVILGKMKFDKEKWRGFALISLGTIALVLTIIEFVISSALYTFYVIFGSFAVYYVLWKVENGLTSEEAGKKVITDTEALLESALKEIRKK